MKSKRKTRPALYAQCNCGAYQARGDVGVAPWDHRSDCRLYSPKPEPAKMGAVEVTTARIETDSGPGVVLSITTVLTPEAARQIAAALAAQVTTEAVAALADRRPA